MLWRFSPNCYAERMLCSFLLGKYLKEEDNLENRKGIPNTAIISGSTWSKAWTPE